MLFVKALFVIAVTYACNECDLDFHVIDLTHTIGPMEVKFPDQPPWNFTILTRGFSRRAQIWYAQLILRSVTFSISIIFCEGFQNFFSFHIFLRPTFFLYLCAILIFHLSLPFAADFF